MTAQAPTRRSALSTLALIGAALLSTPAFAAGAGDTPAGNCTPRIAIANEAGRPVQEVFIRASGSAAWGRDLLGDAVVRTGQAVEIRPTGTGLVDLMVMTPDGTARALFRVNACAVRRVTLSQAMALRAE